MGHEEEQNERGTTACVYVDGDVYLQIMSASSCTA